MREAIVPAVGKADETWFPWAREYDTHEWLDVLLTRSDHLALEAEIRKQLFEAIGGTIDDYGGSFEMSFETGLIAATRT